MREDVTYLAPEASARIPKVLIARTALYLKRGDLARLIGNAGLIPRPSAREIDAVRTAWIHWLDLAPRTFTHFTDAFYQFAEDLRSGAFDSECLGGRLRPLEALPSADRVPVKGSAH